MNIVISLKNYSLGKLHKLKKITSNKEKISGVLEKIGIISSTLMLILSLYSLISDRFWSMFITEFSNGLAPIASVSDEKGSNIKKTSVDTLWLPLFSKATIFFGDIIQTNKQSAVNIELNSKISFRIEEESLVRIKIFDGKPMLRLSSGTIQTNFLQDQTLLIKRGSKIEAVTIQKGSYFIKNESTAGVQITKHYQETRKEAGERKSQQTKYKSKTEENEENSTEDSEENSTAEQQKVNIDYHLPYPQNKTLFLIKTPIEIFIAAQIKCKDYCSLKVYRNNKLIVDMKRNKNEDSFVKLSASQAVEGSYDWEFSSEVIEHKANFVIKKFNEHDIFKAIEEGYSIEIP